MSVAFVGFELQANTSVARAQARNDLAALSQEWLLVLGQDSAANRAWRATWSPDPGSPPPSAAEANQAYYLMIAMVRRVETIYHHYQEGLIPIEALSNYGIGTPAFRGVRFREEFWPEMRQQFDAGFVEFFESTW